MTLWHCLNCTDDRGNRGRQFRSPVPVCECGVDGRKPEYKFHIFKCVVVHFEPPHPVFKACGTGKALCDGRERNKMNHKAETTTASYATVNCEACLAHPDFPGREPSETVVDETADYMV
jgi:hypothetical protein